MGPHPHECYHCICDCTLSLTRFQFARSAVVELKREGASKSIKSNYVNFFILLLPMVACIEEIIVQGKDLVVLSFTPGFEGQLGFGVTRKFACFLA